MSTENLIRQAAVKKNVTPQTRTVVRENLIQALDVLRSGEFEASISKISSYVDCLHINVELMDFFEDACDLAEEYIDNGSRGTGDLEEIFGQLQNAVCARKDALEQYENIAMLWDEMENKLPYIIDEMENIINE